jgi:putative PIN family toxin of toxin-antitoxin system
MSRARRWVLDTNVVLSALVFAGGRLARLRSAWRTGLCNPLVSRATTAELVRALAYPKFKLTTDEQNELLADYLPYCEAIAVPVQVPRVPLCRDPADIRFLKLALHARADALVSGDGDLLALAPVFACSIVPPAEALAILSR